MKTKDKISFFCGPMFVVMGVIVCIVIIGVVSLYQKQKEDSIAEFWYIPAGQTQIIVKWVEKASGLYYMDAEVLVVSEKGDTMIVKATNHFPGSVLVLYKDSYPPSKGKKVFVELTEVFGETVITAASLTPFKK